MKVHYHTLSARNQRRNAMPYLETVQELLDDGTSLSTNLVLSWNELRTNLRVTCGKLATNLRHDTQDQYSSCRRNY